jgi:glyoxylase-like metal-dependent hydrolase (beta-lactamase superfamily II)
MLKKFAGSGTVVNEWVNDGDDIDLGSGIRLKVIHTPGHTRGCICLYWEQEGLLFAGDSIQGLGLFPGWLPFYFHAAEYLQSMNRLSELTIKTLCLGHPIQTSGRSRQAVRRGEAAARTIRESLETALLIEEAASRAAESNPASSDPLSLAMKVITELQYEMPLILHRDFGAPVNSLATVMAHLNEKKTLI